MTTSNKHIAIIGSIAAGILLVVAAVYYLVSIQPEGPPDAELAMRGVDSYWKLWRNGYFRHFFHFEYFGNMNWKKCLKYPLSQSFQ